MRANKTTTKNKPQPRAKEWTAIMYDTAMPLGKRLAAAEKLLAILDAEEQAEGAKHEKT